LSLSRSTFSILAYPSNRVKQFWKFVIFSLQHFPPFTISPYLPQKPLHIHPPSASTCQFPYQPVFPLRS